MAFKFPPPIKYFDLHFYFNEHSDEDIKSISSLRQSFISQFPELRVFDLVKRPVGPHPIGMFEAHVTTQEDLGKVISWLLVNRNGHSILVHPNTPNELLDHSEHAIWLGRPHILNLAIFHK